MGVSYWEYMLDLRVIEKMACSVDEKRTLLPLIDRIVGFSERARRDGILVLEAELESDDMPPLLKRGLCLAVDGTDPDIIRKNLYYSSLCGGAKGAELLRNMIMMEGVMVIQQGANPRIVKDSLIALLGDDFIGEAEEYFKQGGEGSRLESKVVGWLVANAARPAREGLALLEEPFAKMFPAGVMAVLRNVERDELAVALAGASGLTVHRVLRAMSTRAAAMFIQDMERCEAVPDAPVLRAQKRVMEVVGRLVETGDVFYLR